jgi:hypothetical protein
VEANASTKFGGKSLINQIVSFINISNGFWYSGFFSSNSLKIVNFQTLVPSVAKSLSSLKTHFQVKVFIRDDFQALV